MTDYGEEQRNELEALESIYPDSFTGDCRRRAALGLAAGPGRRRAQGGRVAASCVSPPLPHPPQFLSPKCPSV